jgi:uncharacterized protein (TIGR02246 family)
MHSAIQNHSPSADSEPRAIAAHFLNELQNAWNRADSGAFAAPFIDGAAFVDIRGQLHHGRAAIAEGHDVIFNTIYKGSNVRLEVLDARIVAAGCILFHGAGTLEVPDGPVKGTIQSTQTLLAVHGGSASESGWALAAFHNTVRR